MLRAGVAATKRPLDMLTKCPAAAFLQGELKNTKPSKPSQKPARSQPEASQKPARSQPEASQKPTKPSQKPATTSQNPAKKPASPKASQEPTKPSQKPARSQPGASQEPARSQPKASQCTSRRIKAVEDAGAFRAPTNAAKLQPPVRRRAGRGLHDRPEHGGPAFQGSGNAAGRLTRWGRPAAVRQLDDFLGPPRPRTLD